MRTQDFFDNNGSKSRNDALSGCYWFCACG